MLIDMIIFRAAMTRRTATPTFEARPRDFVTLGSVVDAANAQVGPSTTPAATVR